MWRDGPAVKRKGRFHEVRSARPEQIMVGKVPVGGGAPISVQSMTTTKTADVDLCPSTGGTRYEVEALTFPQSERYQMDITKAMPLTYAVFALILILGVTALYLDVTHPLGNPFG